MAAAGSRGLSWATSLRNAGRLVVAMNASPTPGVRQILARRCHRVVEQHTRVDQRCAGERIGVLDRPVQSPRAAEVVQDEVHRVDLELIDDPREVPGVTVDGVVEVRRLVGGAITGHVRRDCSRELAGPLKEVHPVILRARVAVHEYDGLGRFHVPDLQDR